MTIFKKVLAFLGFGSMVFAAPLTATDVDFTNAVNDLSVVFLAIVGVLVIIFGYKRILGLLSR